MALNDDVACTITLTSGSRDFTVAGANLTTAAIEPGDEIKLPLKGLTLTIGEVLTATTGKLTDNCPAAAAGAAQTARLRYQPDLARAAAKFEDLLVKLGDGNLEALADLSLANNKGIYASGLNTLATYDLTPAARAVLALAGAAGAKMPVVTNTNAAALRDIVGTVSQSGGVPTGAIVAERLSNANGAAIKFVGGLMVCIRTVTVDMTTTSTQLFDTPVTSVGNGVANGSIVTVSTGVNYAAWGLFTFRAASSVWQLRGPGTGSGTESAILSALGFWHS